MFNLVRQIVVAFLMENLSPVNEVDAVSASTFDDLLRIDGIFIVWRVSIHAPTRGATILVAYIPASIHNEAMLSGAWTSIAQ